MMHNPIVPEHLVISAYKPVYKHALPKDSTDTDEIIHYQVLKDGVKQEKYLTKAALKKSGKFSSSAIGNMVNYSKMNNGYSIDLIYCGIQIKKVFEIVFETESVIDACKFLKISNKAFRKVLDGDCRVKGYYINIVELEE